jgi:MFS family permease
MKLFNRTTTDGEHAATQAEAADAEAQEADRVEAAELADTTPRGEVVTEAERAVGVAAARERFGGLDLPAGLVGMLTALSALVLIAGLVGAAVGVVGYQTGLDEENVDDISLASLIGGVAILFLAFVIGGWAAGRIARYDGAKNGLMAAVWTLVLAAILSALAAVFGDEYDVFRNVDLPQWFDTDAFTVTAIVSGLAAILAMLVGGALGGAWGELYHRRADRTIVGEPARRFWRR